MGKGCVPSNKKVPYGVVNDTRAAAAAVGLREAPIPVEDSMSESAVNNSAAAGNSVGQSTEKLKIFIVFYSMYGHVEGLARRMKKGVDGVEGVLYRVAETLPAEVLEQMKAPPKDDSLQEITAAELVKADGLLFGFPTRYGSMAAQMKAFFDSIGQLWKEQKLAGKPAGFFVSTGTQGGGQETTA